MKRRLISTIVLVFCILFFSSMVAQTTKWRDMYKVKKKDTIFGIAKQYGLTVPELMDANPDMKKEGYELKKGDFVFIPFAKSAPAPSTRVTKAATPAADHSIRIGVMLPLHDVDGDGRRMVEYYRGLLMACDSLRKEGISTDVHAWNVSADADIAQQQMPRIAPDFLPRTLCRYFSAAKTA